MHCCLAQLHSPSTLASAVVLRHPRTLSLLTESRQPSLVLPSLNTQALPRSVGCLAQATSLFPSAPHCAVVLFPALTRPLVLRRVVARAPALNTHACVAALHSSIKSCCSPLALLSPKLSSASRQSSLVLPSLNTRAPRSCYTAAACAASPFQHYRHSRLCSRASIRLVSIESPGLPTQRTLASDSESSDSDVDWTSSDDDSSTAPRAPGNLIALSAQYRPSSYTSSPTRRPSKAPKFPSPLFHPTSSDDGSQLNCPLAPHWR